MPALEALFKTNFKTNSKLSRPQFNSTSLNRHLGRTYNTGAGVRFAGDGFVEVLAATQTPDDKEWFQARCTTKSQLLSTEIFGS